MNAARTLATAARVLRQLRHDPRTIALLLVIPSLMTILLRYVFDGSPAVFNSIGASLLGIFPLITMFLVSSIATLRERTSGTLERLLAMPLGKGDLIGGYALAFGALAVLLAVDALSDGTPGADIMRGTTLAPDFAEIGLECVCLPEGGSVGDRVAARGDRRGPGGVEVGPDRLAGGCPPGGG